MTDGQSSINNNGNKPSCRLSAPVGQRLERVHSVRRRKIPGLPLRPLQAATRTDALPGELRSVRWAPIPVRAAVAGGKSSLLINQADCNFGLPFLGIKFGPRIGQIDLETTTKPITFLGFRHVPLDVSFVGPIDQSRIGHPAN